VQHRKGTQVVAKGRDGSTVTRWTAHFKTVPYQTPKEAGRWRLGPDSRHKPSAEPKARELPRLQECPEKMRLPEVGPSDPLDRMKPPTEYIEEAPKPSLPLDASGCSSRPRKSVDEYLKSKYPNHVLLDRIQ